MRPVDHRNVRGDRGNHAKYYEEVSVTEDIDESKSYHLIHTRMQLKIKMKTDTIVDMLKARLCACGHELTEVDHETYSPYTTG